MTEKQSFLEIVEKSSLPQEKKQEFKTKLDKIIKALCVYEKDLPGEVSYIKELLNSRLNQINTLGNQDNFLSKDDLLSIGIVEVKSGDNAYDLLSKFNINPSGNSFLDGNTKLKQGENEFLTPETIMTIRLKKLESQGILTFGKDNIPVLKGVDLTPSEQMEVLGIMSDFVDFQIKKGFGDKYSKIKNEIESLKTKYSEAISGTITNLSKKITDTDVNKMKNGLIESVKGSEISDKNGLIKEITDWFNDDSVDIKVKIAIILAVGALGVAAIYLAGPAIMAGIGGISNGANVLIIRALFSASNSQRVFPLIAGLAPMSGKLELNRIFNFNPIQTNFFNAGRLGKEAFQAVGQQVTVLFSSMSKDLSYSR